MAGARGFTSGLVNVKPELSLQMIHSLRQGEYEGAMLVCELIRAFEEMRARRNNALNVSVVKEAMAQLGLVRRTVRPPISELTPAERAEVAAIIQHWRS